jgi:hypothetical protein
MAYLRHCLEEMRRYQGDPQWHIPLDDSSLPRCAETIDAPHSTDASVIQLATHSHEKRWTGTGQRGALKAGLEDIGGLKADLAQALDNDEGSARVGESPRLIALNRCPAKGFSAQALGEALTYFASAFGTSIAASTISGRCRRRAGPEVHSG